MDHPNQVRFLVQSNTDGPDGGCISRHGLGCQWPFVDPMTTSTAPQIVAWTDLSGGEPVPALDPSQVCGFEWAIDEDASRTPFAVHIVLDDFKLLGGPSTPTVCE